MSLPTLDNLAPKEAGGAATKFPGIVADLDTRPNAIGGLSAAELKAKFDEAARVIQNYINNVLLPALLSSGATSIGYQASAADLPDYRPDTVSDALAGLENLISSLLPIKVNGKVCFCNNLTIPSSGTISVAYNSIYPRPLAGDYVVNQNGELGHITSVVIGDVVTITAANYTLKAVLTDETQNLSATQKARARSNIGALGPADTEAKYVKYDDYASYTDAQKATARANIGALEKANPHVETRMTVDGVLDAEGGIEAYDDVTVEGALIVKASSQENGVSVSQTDAAVLSFAGATPQTKPVLRNVGTPVLNNDAANKAYTDAADAAQAQQTAETYLPKANPAATGELTIEGELTVAGTLGAEVHVQAGSGNAMVLQGGSNHAGTVEIKGVGTPTADSSAAPKGYVDTQIAGVNKILLYDGTISATAGDTAALSTTSFSPQNAILGDVVVGTNGYTAAVVTKLTPTTFVVRSTGQQFAPGGGGGLSSTAKQALLNCFAHVAWTDEHGQDYYDALEAALYPSAELASISAVFNQGQTVVYDTDSLDVLKPMLTVTAHYSDETTETVTAYTLSGTLTEGTSTITVSYGGKTATFDVVVTDPTGLPSEYQKVEWVGVQNSTTTPTAYIYAGPDVISVGDTLKAEVKPFSIVGAYDSPLGMYGLPSAINWELYYTDDGNRLNTDGAGVFSSTSFVIGDWDEVTLKFAKATGLRILTYKTDAYAFNGKVKSLSIENANGIITHNYIPCYRKADGVIGVYDIVTSTFLTKSGRGSLVKGDDI